MTTHRKEVHSTERLHGFTYNVFLGKHLARILNWLADGHTHVDFCCFQEFPESRVQELEKYFNPKEYTIHFASGFTWRDVTYGEVTVFKKSVLELVETKTLLLGGKGEPNIVFLRDGLKFDIRLARLQHDKSALMTTFRYQGQRFSLVNAHLSSDIYNSRKLKQLTYIMQSVDRATPSIILGDFNYPIGRSLHKLMNRHQFVSAFSQKTFRFAPGLYWQNDYIFSADVE